MSAKLCGLSLVAAIELAFAGQVALAADTAFEVDDAVSASRTFTLAELATLPRTITARGDHGRQLTCEGVALIDLLARVGLPTGGAVRGAAPTTIIVASARDGYRVAFTLGEVDQALGNTGVVVVDRCNGESLDAQAGPLRLVLPDDRRGARSVRQLERLSITVPAAP